MRAWAKSCFVVTMLLALRADAGSASDWLVENVRPPPIRVQADADYTEYNVCNKTAVDLSVALMYLTAPGSGERIVEGWWIVAASNCLSLGRRPRGPICAHYFGGNLSTAGSEGGLDGCVVLTAAFKYVLSPERQCQTGEEVRKFFCMNVDAPTFTFTVNPPTE